MKSADLFWAQIASYNLDTWIGQLVLLAAGVVVTSVALSIPRRETRTALKLYLAALFAWLAIAFFWLHDRTWIGRVDTLLFLGIAALFVLDARRDGSVFVLPSDALRRSLTVAIIVLVLAFPFLGMLQGRELPYLLSPVMPCPAAAYALALLASAAPRVNRLVSVPLLVWAVLAIPKMFGQYGAREDTVLVLAGAYLGTVLAAQGLAARRTSRASPS